LRTLKGGEMEIGLHVEVTAADIKNGRQNHCRLCPVALAAKRSFAAWCIVRVNTTQCQCHLWHSAIDGDGKRYIAELPHHVRVWIRNFDAGRKPFEPIEFDLLFQPVP
jgi:hypothetical protein